LSWASARRHAIPEAAFVSTFHGFCARLLRVHPLAADSTPTLRSSTKAWLRACVGWRGRLR